MMLVFFFGMGVVAAGGAGAERLAAGRRAHAAGRVLGHLPPGGHPDAAAAQPKPGAPSASTGCQGNLGIAGAALAHRPAGAPGRLARGLCSAGVAVLGWVCCLPAGAARGAAAVPAHGHRHRAAGPGQLARVLAVMTVAAIAPALLFNLTTNGNAQLMSERLRAWCTTRRTWACCWRGVCAGQPVAGGGGPADRPRAAQAAVPGHRAVQAPLLALAAQAQGWWICIGAAGRDGADLRRHPVHRRDDRALRRRPAALSAWPACG
jgi:hypothetical protein